MSANMLAMTSESADALRPLRILLKETQYELASRMRTRAYSLSVIGLPVMFYLLFGLANRGKPGRCIWSPATPAGVSCRRACSGSAWRSRWSGPRAGST